MKFSKHNPNQTRQYFRVSHFLGIQLIVLIAIFLTSYIIKIVRSIV